MVSAYRGGFNNGGRDSGFDFYISMNFTKIKYFIMDSLLWIAAHWWIAAAVGVLLLIILIAGGIQSCSEGRTQKKIDDIKTNVTTGKVESNVMANEIKNNEKNTNIAANNFNNSVRTDSNRYTGANIDDKFCRRYPTDSTCADWRRRNGVQPAP